MKLRNNFTLLTILIINLLAFSTYTITICNAQSANSQPTSNELDPSNGINGDDQLDQGTVDDDDTTDASDIDLINAPISKLMKQPKILAKGKIIYI